MNFTVTHDYARLGRVIQCDWRDAQGVPKSLKYSIDDRCFIDAGIDGSQRILELAKERLRRAAERDIQESLRRVENMSTYYSSYYEPMYGGSDWGATTSAAVTSTATITPQQMYGGSVSWDYAQSGMVNAVSKVKIKLKLGRHILEIQKDYNGGEIEINQEDIDKAKIEYIKNLNVNIIVKKAESKAENLLKMFISEVDFRNYKEKGYFTVKSGNRLFRIHKDSHKWVDMWERRRDGVFVPKNRLCTHTERRELPIADETLQKLMLVKSNRILEYANPYAVDNSMSEIHEKELVLV